MAQNMDRLCSIHKHLSLSPNSHGKFALSLGERLAEYFICLDSPLTMLRKLPDEDPENQLDAYTLE